jgi:D-glycero-D-manno-heptose 1,7-bisphosphate phosphatase
VSASEIKNRALFLDRDGVINVDRGYVHRPEDFEFVDGVFSVVHRAAELGLCTVVVTNQAGIARGFYSESDFESLTRWMCRRFSAEGAPLTAVYHCPYHAEGLGQWRVADHPDRKPNPGMLKRAISELSLDARRSLLVGDQETDILAARSAELGAAALFAPNGPPPKTLANAVLRNHGETLRWLDEAVAAPAAHRGGWPA